MNNKKNVSKEKGQLETIGVTFRNRRLDLKLSFQEVETRSKVSAYTISKLEKGELENSSLSTLNKIAKVLKLELSFTADPV